MTDKGKAAALAGLEGHIVRLSFTDGQIVLARLLDVDITQGGRELVYDVLAVEVWGDVVPFDVTQRVCATAALADLRHRDCLDTQEQTGAEALVGILLDRNARPDERDDAAMDLGNHPGSLSVAALSAIAMDPEEDYVVAASSGESLAEIWLAQDRFDPAVFERLAGAARAEAESLIRTHRPDWLSRDL